MRALARCGLILGALGGPASAGVTYYGWLPGTDVLAERGTAIEGWIAERNDLGDARLRETAVGAAPVLAASDRFELAVPFEVARTTALGVEPSFTLRWFAIEGRFAVVPRAAAVRVALERDVVIRNLGRLRLEPVVAIERGRFHAAIEAGAIFEANPGGLHLELRPGAGASVRLTRELRAGVELHGELSLDAAGTTWVAAGPNLAWIRGRSWLVGALGVGVYNIQTAPRIAWGLAF